MLESLRSLNFNIGLLSTYVWYTLIIREPVVHVFHAENVMLK